MRAAVTDRLDRAVEQLELRVAELEREATFSVLSVLDGTVTLVNGWAESDATNRPVRVLRYRDGRVRIVGALDATAATGDIAFYLPETWRPAKVLKRIVARDVDATLPNAWGEVDTDGSVSLARTGTPTQIDLDTLDFEAAQ